MRRFVSLALLLVAAAACASGSGGSAAGGGGTRAASRPMGGGSSNLITEQEIMRGQYSNALEIVENLRPSMLRSRASTLSNPNTTGVSADQAASVNVVIFLDEIRLGEPSRLAGIPAASIREIRYINARDATTRWGTGFGSGVILVISKK